MNILLSSETAYIWSTAKNEIISQKHIGKNQRILGVSHSFIFIGNLYNKIICSNLKTNEIKTINSLCNFNELCRVSITKDLKKLLIAVSSYGNDNDIRDCTTIIGVINTDTGLIICSIQYIKKDYGFYFTNRFIIFVDSMFKYDFFDLETGNPIEIINSYNLTCDMTTFLGSADGRYLCLVKSYEYVLIDTEDVDKFLCINFYDKIIDSLMNNSINFFCKDVIPLIFKRYYQSPIFESTEDLFNLIFIEERYACY